MSIRRETLDQSLIERLWRLHHRGLSYASDRPCVNLLLADLSEGLKLAAERLSSPYEGITTLLRERAKQRPSEGLIKRQGITEDAIRYGQALLGAMADEIERWANTEQVSA